MLNISIISVRSRFGDRSYKNIKRRDSELAPTEEVVNYLYNSPQ
jgi:hypothetical protein